MNKPEYSLIEIIRSIVVAVKTQLQLTELNYQHGYITELNETLQQWSKTEEYANKKYPLIWFVEPFTVRLVKSSGIYGTADNLRFFIITDSSKTLKADDRRVQKFVPIIDPIRRAFLEQIEASPEVLYDGTADITDRYYWGEQQQSQLNDVVDCTEINRLSLSIYNNPNC